MMHVETVHEKRSDHACTYCPGRNWLKNASGSLATTLQSDDDADRDTKLCQLGGIELWRKAKGKALAVVRGCTVGLCKNRRNGSSLGRGWRASSSRPFAGMAEPQIRNNVRVIRGRSRRCVFLHFFPRFPS